METVRLFASAAERDEAEDRMLASTLDTLATLFDRNPATCEWIRPDYLREQADRIRTRLVNAARDRAPAAAPDAGDESDAPRDGHREDA